MPTFFHVVAARIRAVFRSGALDSEFDQELQTHLAMAEEHKVRHGMTREEARRSARVELGGMTQLREVNREARGLPWLGSSWLDIKLAVRMLRKSWGLTLVGGLAMTIAIAIGTIIFAVFGLIFGGTLPLDEGDRVVAIQVWDELAHRRHDTSMLDVERWRISVRSVEDVGAFQAVERSLGAADGPATRPVSVAEMTASGFQLARVAPLLGRPLVEDDERQGAAPVVVIGHDVWQSRFSASPAVVGQTLRLSGVLHTVVGVMPQGFAFPMNHRFWTPLRRGPTDDLRNEGPEGVVFARLAAGVTLEGAETELTTLGLLAVPETGEQLHPRVVPYTLAFTGDNESGEARWMVRIILFLVTLLLIPPCANIAILVYARTVTRQEEFAARFALGASRSRIVGQLFIEVLVLAAGAAGVALFIARLTLRQLETFTNQAATDGAPFWMDFELSFSTILFTAGLAIFAAIIAGVVPALKATGRRMQSGLRALGSRTGAQLGATWTALVVVQIAVSLAVLPAAIEIGWGTLRPGILGPGFAADEFLTARLMTDRDMFAGTAVEGDQRSFATRFGAVQDDLVRQLNAEPGVSGVTVAATVPGEEPWVRIEVDGDASPDDGLSGANMLVRFNHVDGGFLDVFDVSLLTGRPFDIGDFEPEPAAVIVNRTFAQQHLGDANPLGRRIRRVPTSPEATGAERGRWYEVVGVVDDLPANVNYGTMYHPMPPGQVHPASLSLRVEPGAVGVADRLRDITTALNPALGVEDILPLDDVYREHQVGNNMGALALAAATLSVLLLSAAGMYALMSFTVNQRRREIGIRSALGAQPRRLLAGIFRRALTQLAVGATAGVVVAGLLDYYLPMEQLDGASVPAVVPAAALLMIVIGLLAAAGPARRGLKVEPTEALRDG